MTIIDTPTHTATPAAPTVEPLTEIEQVVAWVRALAEEQPDFVYTVVGNDCKYEPDADNPNGCIVGAAMRNFGKSVDGRAYNGYAAQDAVRKSLGMDLIEAPTIHARWINWVQTRQDTGRSWSEAVKQADREITL